MEKFDEIWLFIEKKLNTPIPTYFKNILKVCGYNNGITIASIEEDDVTYFESEVRNGNVKNYYKGKDTQIILEGSTKTMENFEFSRGHKKFLMSIVDFLKKYIEQNGPNSFILEEPPKKNPIKDKAKKLVQSVRPATLKRKFPWIDSSFVENLAIQAPFNGKSEAISYEDIKKHRKILLSKSIESLQSHSSSEIFEKVKMQISSDLVRIVTTNDSSDKPANATPKESLEGSEEQSEEESKKAPLLNAKICCPFCATQITVFHVPTETNAFLWNSSNFDRHLKYIQCNQAKDLSDNIQTNDVPKKDDTTVVTTVGKSVKENIPVGKTQKRIVENLADNIETNDVPKKGDTTRGIRVKKSWMENIPMEKTQKRVVENLADNIETNDVPKKGDTTRGIRVKKSWMENIPMEKTQKRVVENLADNIETNDVPKKGDTTRGIRVKKSWMENIPMEKTQKRVVENLADNIETNDVPKKGDTTRGIRVKKSWMENIPMEKTQKRVVENLADNIETNDVPKKGDTTRGIRVKKSWMENIPMEKTQKRVVENLADNIETNDVPKKGDTTRGTRAKKSRKENIHMQKTQKNFVENLADNNYVPEKDSTTLGTRVKKSQKENIPMKKTQEYVVKKPLKVSVIPHDTSKETSKWCSPSIVCYSDTSEEEQESEIAHSCNEPHGFDETIDAIAGETSNKVSFPRLIYQRVPVLKNGYRSHYEKYVIITKNTCGFDSIFSIFTCLYFDDLNFRKYIDSSRSKFCELIKTFFNIINSTSELTSSALEKVYVDRNIVLKDLFWYPNNLPMNEDRIYIDCNTGIGELYAQICLEMDESIASAIEERTCSHCKTTKGKLLPFLALLPIRNLEEIQNSVDLNFLHRSCTICKNECDAKKYYNNLLVLEVEPTNEIQRHNKIALKNVSQTINVNNKEYKLCAVIQYDHLMKHFLAQVRRINNEWKCYDDIRYSENNTEDWIEINPFLLFYISVDHCNDFKTSFSSFLCENEPRQARMPLNRKDSRCDEIHSETMEQQYSLGCDLNYQ